jgi:hypothetical protein
MNLSFGFCLFFGKANLDKPFAAISFNQQQHARPTGIHGFANRCGKIGSAVHTALPEPADDITGLHTLFHGRAASRNFGNNNPG